MGLVVCMLQEFKEMAVHLKAVWEGRIDRFIEPE